MRRQRSLGQTLVEFALVIPVFLVVIFGLVDIGRLVYTNSVLSQSAREGARLGAVEASWIHHGVVGDPQFDVSCGTQGGPVCPADVATLKSHIVAAANRMVAGAGGSVSTVYVRCDTPGNAPIGSWTGSTCANNGPGNVLSIRVVFTFTPITPIIGQLVGPVTLTASATMVIN